MSKNLKLNFLNVNDVVQAIDILINYNIQSGEYLVKSKNFTKVENLIKWTNLQSSEIYHAMCITINSSCHYGSVVT